MRRLMISNRQKFCSVSAATSIATDSIANGAIAGFGDGCMIFPKLTHEATMRTNIDIDDALLAEAMELSEFKTKKAVIEQALRHFVTHHSRRKALEELRGTGWHGDLDKMRSGQDSYADSHSDAAE